MLGSAIGSGEAPLRRPIDWLKIYPNLVVFFHLFTSILLIFFLSGHWKTSNLVEQTIEITIQCKYEITQITFETIKKHSTGERTLSARLSSVNKALNERK